MKKNGFAFRVVLNNILEANSLGNVIKETLVGALQWKRLTSKKGEMCSSFSGSRMRLKDYSLRLLSEHTFVKKLHELLKLELAFLHHMFHSNEAVVRNAPFSLVRMFAKLSWLEVLLCATSRLIYTSIKKHLLVKAAQGRYCFDKFKIYMQTSVYAFFDFVVVLNTIPQEERIMWKVHFGIFALELYAATSVSNIFNMIAEFPETSSFMHDISTCTKCTQQRRKLLYTINVTILDRLLHSGANTAQIIDIYVLCINSLKGLGMCNYDSCVVKKPIVDYLRKRPDTVRCVVDLLTSDSTLNSFVKLNGETHKSSLFQGWLGNVPWYPNSYKTAMEDETNNDILAEMTQIYGSKELFVKEYCRSLAQKLLLYSDYETECELHRLELLKLRFGEGLMQTCDVMLNDVEKSKRINSIIHDAMNNTESDGFALECDVLVISEKYWPDVPTDSFFLHGSIYEKLKDFSVQYSLLKKPRQLSFKRGLGFADVEIAFDSGDVRVYKVPTLHANIISFFSHQASWDALDLSNKLRIDVSVLKMKILLWVNKGVLNVETTCVNGKKNIIYVAAVSPPDTESCAAVDNFSTNAAEDSYEEPSEGMVLYKAYIVGMLTQFSSLTLDRVHENLKMFAFFGENRYQRSKIQLKSYLEDLIEQGDIEFISGEYQLVN